MYRVPETVHQELLNWSRWCWMGEWPHPLPDTRCGSAERDFHEEWHSEVSPDDPQRIRPNERHARVVQRVFESLEGYPRLTIKAEYPGNDMQSSRHQRAIKLGLTVQQYENNLQIGVSRVESAFAVRL